MAYERREWMAGKEAIMIFSGKGTLNGGEKVCLPGIVGGRVNTDA
jgi:hypothetical protein